MVERNETPWAFRPPKSAENREKAVAIAKAKDIAFNALVASYVVQGIERDWKKLHPADAVITAESIKRNTIVDLDGMGEPVPQWKQDLYRSDVSPNLKGKK